MTAKNYCDANTSGMSDLDSAIPSSDRRLLGKHQSLYLSVTLVAALAASQPANADGLPDPGVKIERGNTALLVTDPQNDFLSPDGVTWGVVGESVVENDTVKHIGQLFGAAQSVGMPVFISPHYYYTHDHRWQFEGALEVLMHNIGMFDREGPLTTEGFEGSGADWLEQYKVFINDEKTVVTSPHKVFGPETNDLALQLRKAGISRVILAGMSANLCVEAHMRELIEQGFEVLVVADATAAAKLPNLDGYKAALTNFRMIANHVGKTEDVVANIELAYAK